MPEKDGQVLEEIEFGEEWAYSPKKVLEYVVVHELVHFEEKTTHHASGSELRSCSRSSEGVENGWMNNRALLVYTEDDVL